MLCDPLSIHDILGHFGDLKYFQIYKIKSTYFKVFKMVLELCRNWKTSLTLRFNPGQNVYQTVLSVKLMHKSCFFYSLRLRNSKVKSKFEFQEKLENWNHCAKCKQLTSRVAPTRVLLNHQLTTEKFSCSLRPQRAHNHFSAESNQNSKPSLV